MTPAIGKTVNSLLLAGHTNQETLLAIRVLFPTCNTKLHNISWYRSELTRELGPTHPLSQRKVRTHQ